MQPLPASSVSPLQAERNKTLAQAVVASLFCLHRAVGPSVCARLQRSTGALQCRVTDCANGQATL